MNEIQIILITLCSILLFFIGVRMASNLIEEVTESEYINFGDNFFA